MSRLTLIRHMLLATSLKLSLPSVLVSVEQGNSLNESYVCPTLNGKMLELHGTIVIFYLRLLFLQKKKQA